MQQPTAPPPPAAPPATSAAASTARKRMNPAAIVGIILLVALSFYFMYTYSGPFRWLAELQMKVMSSYSEELTLILTMFVLILPALGIVKVVQVAVRNMGVGGG